MSTRTVQDSLNLMRVILGRRNENDPDSTDAVFLNYLNNFVSLSMPNDVKLFESLGTYSFTIDESANPDGVYDLTTSGANAEFINFSAEAYITLTDPVDGSLSWNYLPIYTDPGQFYAIWGINNVDVLIAGFPTMMLYYGNEFVFRTIPNTSYSIKIFGYKKNPNFDDQNDDLPFDYWLRYITYGACLDYARDYRYDPESRSMIQASFKRERALQLTHMHNYVKLGRSYPRF